VLCLVCLCVYLAQFQPISRHHLQKTNDRDKANMSGIRAAFGMSLPGKKMLADSGYTPDDFFECGFPGEWDHDTYVPIR
jgi:hypothetical protein